MSDVIRKVEEQLQQNNLVFAKKPILIGGMAMEYYGMRKSGPDIDLVICDQDYQDLARKYPDKRKDIWGDLGVVLDPFEIWRCIALLDYDFYGKDAIDEGSVSVVSLDRLLLMRVFAMDVPKYREDLKLMNNYYRATYTNPDYLKNAEAHASSYRSTGGTIWSGRYEEE